MPDQKGVSFCILATVWVMICHDILPLVGRSGRLLMSNHLASSISCGSILIWPLK